jgi:hypothetical protein
MRAGLHLQIFSQTAAPLRPVDPLIIERTFVLRRVQPLMSCSDIRDVAVIRDGFEPREFLPDLLGQTQWTAMPQVPHSKKPRPPGRSCAG